MTQNSKSKKKKPVFSTLSNSIWTMKMLCKYAPASFFLTLVLLPVNVGLQFLDIYLPSRVVNEVSTGQNIRSAIINIGFIMLLILIGNLLKQILGTITSAQNGIYLMKLTNTIKSKMGRMFYQTYEKKDIRDLGQRAVIATQMWNGEQPLSDMVSQSFRIVENVLGYILFGTVISFVSPWLILLLTLAPIVNWLAVRAYNRWEYTQRDKTTALSQRLNYVCDLPSDFTIAKDIRIYSLASWLRECYRDLSREQTAWDNKNIRRIFASRIADLFVILLRDGGAYAVLISLVLKGTITVDKFILYFMAVASFASWVGGIIQCWNKIHQSSLRVCDYREYTEYPEEDGSGTARVEDFLEEAPEITFDHVSYRYEDATEDTLHSLSFTIHKGEKLALVGLNGAGKTILVKLLCGLYTPTQGEIRINRTPLSEFHREDYYRLISPVFQDIHAAFFSLAETISGKGLPDTDIEKAVRCAKQAGLGEKLDSLPNGIRTMLDKQVNPEGTELSGGELQKLMLARALYRDAPLLVLDEPTAALDPIAESRIYTEYNNMTKNKTSLFISHRLASTSFCDRILLLKEGRIVEEGTHAELLEEGGEYRKMFDIQSCWYREDGKGRVTV